MAINKSILSYKHELDSLPKVEKVHFDILDFVVDTSPLPNTSKLIPKVAANPLIEKGESSQVEWRKKVKEWIRLYRVGNENMDLKDGFT